MSPFAFGPSTDLVNTASGSTVGGLVGAEVTWTAGFPPMVTAKHECEYLTTPQSTLVWSTMEIDNPCEFPHHGKFCWNSAQPYTPGGPYPHNGDWQLIVRPSVAYDVSPETYQVTRTFELQNLTVEATPEYLKYYPDSGGCEPINYTLKDAFTVCEPAQQTNVTIGICSSDGEHVRTDSLVKLATPGASFSYSWDGKDDAGELAPKGIYTYVVQAEQARDIPNPLNPGTTVPHHEIASDKSNWFINTLEPETIAFDDESATATIRMGFTAVSTSGGLRLSRAKLEVYDPELSMVDSAELEHVPLGQVAYFPNVNVTFNKPGTYVFLVSAWEELVKDAQPIDKDHEEKPLLQQNARLYMRPRHVLIDPGHGAGSENTGTHGCYYDLAPTEQLKNTNRYGWDEHDMVLALGFKLRRSILLECGSRCSMQPVFIYMSRTSSAGMTLSRRVEWADKIAKRMKGMELRFISLHCNGHQKDYNTENFVAWRKADDTAFADYVRLGLLGQPVVRMTYGPNRQENYMVLLCDMPAVLVETATLTCPDEEEWVAWQDDDSNLCLLADRLRDGILMGLDH